ncbi:heptosyltransferase-3 [Maridesulfovibrio ferrireducens]|uniref:Heptosyltransferase-3 n=1 Tax=Maridesulfovibrio ferrireducens TaxID=246191 RepID=A0A1G9FSX3_9BACT|nr:glycosyltransferase family 9 protein [Maridesulfovibrio ferrireducens]SDK91526.1 heptosyltransferase-3 [Maridesulfovibrio ferrireducens]
MKKVKFSCKDGRWLIISNGILGHTLLVLSALKVIKNIYPDSYITMVVDDGSAELVRANPMINKVCIFNRKKDSLYRQWELIKEWRKDKYDVSVHFRSGVRNEILAFLGGVKARIGNKLKGSFQFLNHIGMDINGVHVLEKRSHFMSFVLDQKVELAPPVLHRDPQARADVAKVLAEKGIEPGKYVVLHPAGKTSGGLKWSLDYWAAEVAKIPVEYPIVVVCAPFERELVQEAIKGENVFHLEGSVAFLSEIIAECCWFVGNDSSPGHMAAIWGKSRVIAYNSSSPEEFVKWSPFHPEGCRVVTKEEFIEKGLGEPLNWLFKQ